MFEKNMFKTKAVTPLWFGFGKNMWKEQTTIQETYFFGTKECTKTKSGHTAMCFFPIKTRAEIKSGHTAIHATKKMQQSQKKTRTHSFCRPPISQSLGCRFLQRLSNSSGFLHLGLARSCLVMVATSLPAAAHRIPLPKWRHLLPWEKTFCDPPAAESATYIMLDLVLLRKNARLTFFRGLFKKTDT